MIKSKNKSTRVDKKQTKYKTVRGGRGVKGKLTEEQKAERPWLWKPGTTGNPEGRKPGQVDPVREVARQIAEKRIQSKIPIKYRRLLGLDDEKLTILETMLIDMALSSNPSKQQYFIDRGFGKQANVNVNQNYEVDLKMYASKFTDSELEDVKNGANPFDILFNKLPDVVDEK